MTRGLARLAVDGVLALGAGALAVWSEHRNLIVARDAMAEQLGRDADEILALANQLDQAGTDRAAAERARDGFEAELDDVAALLDDRAGGPAATYPTLRARVAAALDGELVTRDGLVSELTADIDRWCAETPEGRAWAPPEGIRREVAVVLAARVSGWLRAAQVWAAAATRPLDPPDPTDSQIDSQIDTDPWAPAPDSRRNR